MLYRHSEVFRTSLMVVDLLLVAGAWLAAYWIRFYAGIPAPLGIPEFGPYVEALVPILPIWFWLLRSNGLYEPRRTGSLLSEAGSLLRVTAVGVVVLVAISFFTRTYFYSRGVVAIFAVLSPVLVLGLRIALRLGLRSLRRRGYNLRYLVVLGAGELVDAAIERIHAHPEAGLRVRGVLSEGYLGGRDDVRGVPVIGGYSALKEILHRDRVDQVLIALPREQDGRLEKILADLDDEVVSVKLIPDLMNLLSLRSSAEDLDGLPVINLRESPMLGWAVVQKRLFDLAVALPVLVLAAPIMAVIGLAIWATSGRPILYVQERMGLDGRLFRMFKFRTMVDRAEEATGPVWAQQDDPRRTRLGGWLRSVSADELPQLWNVLRGDMSLVGPRPERPIFIEEFRREIPGYMLRHKVKAGLTGWAQVHGWRGDTSLHERVEHDIYYIQHWSPGLDVQILFTTLWKGIFNRNAY
jgi:Undecaprenyl-phosphate glucose phosphotransferase